MVAENPQSSRGTSSLLNSTIILLDELEITFSSQLLNGILVIGPASGPDSLTINFEFPSVSTLYTEIESPS